jgi:hypothetical protein
MTHRSWDDAARHHAETRAVAIEHLENAIRSVEHVVETAQSMIERTLGDRAANEQRIIDGEAELAAMRLEIEALRVGDHEAFLDADDLIADMSPGEAGPGGARAGRASG